MADEDDLITIVDVTDPDDPSYSDMKTRRRYLTDHEMSNLKHMLERVGAYKFFAAEFNFADGPAVKQFIESVELEEFKRCKQRKIVQETMKGTVAGREVVLNSDLIEKAFGLVDDGENIIKPKGETNGLHSFYIKPKYIHLCQNYRGVYLKLFKSEYNYFVNMAHQIQTYCCGGTPESQITLTQYRAIDLMIRGKPVNWNRYLLQNIQDKLRKYKSGPCTLYFAGTLTALIYKALNVDYNLVNKPLLLTPPTPERLALTEGDKGGKSTGKKKVKESGQKLIKAAPPPPPKKRESMRREVGALTRAQRMLTPAPEILELEAPPSKKSSKTAKALQEKKRKRVKERAETGSKKPKSSSSSGKSQQQKPASEPEEEDEEDEEPFTMRNDETEEDMPSSPVYKTPATAPPAYKSLKTPETPTDTPATAPPSYDYTPEATPCTAGGTPYTAGGIRKRVADVEKLGGEVVLATATNRLSKMFAYATGSGREEAPALTESKDLWTRYDHLFSLQHEQQLEHIVSKQMLEQSLRKVQELEEALRAKDEEMSELRSQISNVRNGSSQANQVNQAEQVSEDGDSERCQEQQAPLKIRLKVGQKKVSAVVPGDDQSKENGVVPMETSPQAAEDQAEKRSEKGDSADQVQKSREKAGEGQKAGADERSTEKGDDQEQVEKSSTEEKGDDEKQVQMKNTEKTAAAVGVEEDEEREKSEKKITSKDEEMAEADREKCAENSAAEGSS